MEHRSLSDIYPSWHPSPMDAEDVERTCQRWMYRVKEMGPAAGLSDFTYWISEQYDDPYHREALAGGLWDFLRAHTDPTEDDCVCLSRDDWETLERTLRTIIRHARYDQDEKESNYCDPQTNPDLSRDSTADILARMARMEENMQHYHADHEQRIARVEQLLSERALNAETALCTYIRSNEIKPMEEIEREMANAARTNCPVLVAYIRRAQAVGYIDLRGDSANVVFETLDAHFRLPFKICTWYKYFK